LSDGLEVKFIGDTDGALTSLTLILPISQLRGSRKVNEVTN